jgi:sulfur carrier protein ThiS
VEIIVEVHGTLRAYLEDYDSSNNLQVPDRSTVGDVIRLLGIPIERGWNASIQSKLVSDEAILHPGSHLKIFDVIGGG